MVFTQKTPHIFALHKKHYIKISKIAVANLNLFPRWMLNINFHYLNVIGFLIVMAFTLKITSILVILLVSGLTIKMK